METKTKYILVFILLIGLITGVGAIFYQNVKMEFDDISNIITKEESFTGVYSNNSIGYEFLDGGDVVHIWNNIDDYYFNKTSGIQLTNHFEEYWTHNTFCGGRWSGSEWLDFCQDEIPFTWTLDSDNSSYVFLHGYYDISYAGKNIRFSINYSLKLNDNEIKIDMDAVSGKKAIPEPLRFIWKIDDIRINMTTDDNDYYINNTWYNANESLDLVFNNLSETKFYAIHAPSEEFLYLKWDNQSDYSFKINNESGQVNAPVSLYINIADGLQSYDSFNTTMYWIDAKPSPNVISGADDSPDPQDIGSAITFVGTGTSTGGGSYSYDMYVCNTSAFLAGCAAGAELCTDTSVPDTQEGTCDYTALASDPAASPVSYWINSRNTNGNDWSAEDDGGGSQGTYSVNALPEVQWNQSALDLGESVNNITSILEISSTIDNTNTNVTCTGNCTQITTNWTKRTMTDGQTDEVLITCSNATQGIFQAVFNVTSDEDSSSNLLTVDCEIFSYGTLNVSISKPDDESGWITNDVNLTINASVSCQGGINARCGNISAYAMYGSSTPDTLVNITEGGLPFYIIEQQTDWQPDSEINSSLGDAGADSRPTIFQKDSTWFLISGNFAGTFVGYNWTGTTWQEDSGINSGLGDVGAGSSPTVFQKDSTWFLISGDQTGIFIGYNWTGTTWQSDSGIISSLGDVGLYSSPTVFQKDSTWFLISGESGGTFSGFNWTGTTWQNDSGINSGLGDLGFTQSSPTVFQKDSYWYLISGESDGDFSGFNWTGTTWQSDSEIISGLGDIGADSRPGNVFQKDSNWYLISGENEGVFPSFKIEVTLAANPKNSSLSSGEYFNVSWVLSVTSVTDESYEIDVNFSSSYGNTLVPDNNTEDRTVNLNPSGVDITDPTWSLNQTNNTVADTSTLFSILWDDETALHPGGQYIFSTNNTGAWANESAINFTTTSSWANVTKTLNDTVGLSIGYRWYANDTAGNNNMTDIFSLITTTADTCSYTSGDWNIDCSDDCSISSPVDVGGNDISITGTGTFYTSADITNYGRLFIRGTDSSNICRVTCKSTGCFKN